MYRAQPFIALLLVSIALLLSPGVMSAQEPTTPTETQGCRKQILLFLDVSGSMQPTYRQTLQAFQRVLDSPNFLGDEDELVVYRFGATIGNPQTAQGTGPIRNLVQNLLSSWVPQPYSDFDLAFSQIETQDFDDPRFDFHIVMIASDLVHEPSDGSFAKNSEGFLQSWNLVWNEHQRALRQRFSDSQKRTRLVLLKAEASEHPQVARRVAGDLQNVPQLKSYDVASDSQGAIQLSEDIKASLLFNLEIFARPDTMSQEILFDVQIKNPNCQPLEARELVFRCMNEAGNQQGGLITVPLDGKILPANTPVNVQVAKSQISCAAGVQDYQLRLLSRPPAQDRWVDASYRNRIDYTPKQALKDWSLAGSTLRLFATFGGQTLDPEAIYVVRLLHPDTNTELYSGTIPAPTGLHVGELKPFLLIFPNFTRDIRGLDSLLLEIYAREGDIPPQAQVDIDRNWIDLWHIALTMFACGLLLFGMSRMDHIQFSWMSVIVAILFSPGFTILIQIIVGRFLPDLGEPQMFFTQTLVLGAFLGWITYHYLDRRLDRHLGELLQSGDLNQELQGMRQLIEEQKKPSRNAALVFLFFALLSMVLFFWKIPELVPGFQDPSTLVVRQISP